MRDLVVRAQGGDREAFGRWRSWPVTDCTRWLPGSCATTTWLRMPFRVPSSPPGGNSRCCAIPIASMLGCARCWSTPATPRPDVANRGVGRPGFLPIQPSDVVETAPGTIQLTSAAASSCGRRRPLTGPSETGCSEISGRWSSPRSAEPRSSWRSPARTAPRGRSIDRSSTASDSWTLCLRLPRRASARSQGQPG